MLISDWSSDVCSSDLPLPPAQALHCRRIGGGREAAALVRHSSEAYRQRRRPGDEGRAEAEKFFSSAGLSLSAIPLTIGTFPKWLGSGPSYCSLMTALPFRSTIALDHDRIIEVHDDEKRHT